MMRARNHLKKKPLKLSVWILLFFCINFPAFQIKAQTFYNLNEHYFLKANLGGTAFFGDLSQMTNLNFMLGGQLSKKLGPLFIGSGQMRLGNLSGQKKDLDFYFNAQILEMTVGLGLDLTHLFFGKKFGRRYYVYGSGGAGIAAFWTAKKSLVTDEIIQSKGYKGDAINYSDPTVERVIYIELGLHYKLNEKWELAVSQSFQNLDTDKLDAHYDKSNTFEGYSLFSLGVAYNFNVNIFPSGNNKSSGSRNGFHADETIRDYHKTRSTKKLIGDPFKNRRKKKTYLFLKKKKLTL